MDKIISFRLPNDLHSLIRDAARRNEQTPSGLVRLAVKRYLGLDTPTAGDLTQNGLGAASVQGGEVQHDR